jgi:hypothetical protein
MSFRKKGKSAAGDTIETQGVRMAGNLHKSIGIGVSQFQFGNE